MDGPGLLGRLGERARLDALLAGARASQAGSVVLVGEAGIGKTTLLDYACDRAIQAGVRVLRTRGVESESRLAYAGLADVLRPLDGAADGLADPLRAALDGALGLGPLVPAAPFTVGIATLGVLAAAAEHTPVLIAVDDVHWLDDPSRDALLFAIRRLGYDAIAAVLCERTGEGTQTDPAEWPRLELGGLQPTDARDLVERTTGDRISGPVADRLVEITGGNPLAITEIVRERGHLVPELGAADLPVPESLTRVFLRRLHALPGPTRRTLVVVAASHDGSSDTIIAALAHLGLDVAALTPAETAEIVRIDAGRVSLTHPLLRTVVLDDAPTTTRQEANRALADAAAPGSSERTWYRAAAILGTDACVADELGAVADHTMLVGGPATAATTMVRVAQLTPAGPARAHRFANAARCCLAAGRNTEVPSLLDEALTHATDPGLRAEVATVRAQYETYAGSPSLALNIIAETAPDLAEADPATAALLLSFSVLAAGMSGRIELGERLTGQACELIAGTDPPTEVIYRAGHGSMLALLGRTGEIGDEFVRLCEEAPWRESFVAVMGLLPIPAIGLTWLEDYPRAGRTLGEVIDEARAHSAPAALPYHLAARAQLRWWTGRWVEARADATEAFDLARVTGQPAMLGWASLWLLLVAAAQGNEGECARASAAVQSSVEAGGATLAGYRLHALGLLALGLGRFDEAADRLVEADRRTFEHETRNATIYRHNGDLVEALLRADRRPEAEESVERLATVLADTPSRFGAAVLARTRGLLVGDGDEAEAHFAEAIGAPGAAEIPFETARSQLLLGEWLRRQRRYRDARPHLRAAHDAFAHLGATVWADRAAAELRASGAGGEITTGPGPIDVLTPQELQVALTVAAGHTNREVADALFISQKTVEYHLGKIYKKVGIRSRAQLARVMGDVTTGPTP